MISTEIAKIRAGMPVSRPRVVLTGMYADHLDMWAAKFPKEQMLIVQSEQLFNDTARTHKNVLEFLGLDKVVPPQYERVNRRHWECAEMTDAVRAMLRVFYAPQVKRLYEHYVDWRWDEWQDPS